MRRSYLAGWLALLAGVGAAAEWIMAGKAFVRRAAFGVPPIAEASRTRTSFLAVLLPHIAASGARHAMPAAALRRFLRGLKDSGCVPVGLDDVRELYADGRRLPPRAVLLAFAEDDPAGVGMADAALKDARWRGTLFITGIESSSSAADDRPLLTAHAVSQMRLGEAWEFGAVSSAQPPSAPAAGGIRALLDDDGRRPPPRDAARYPLRFAASELGYNDERNDPAALHMLALRPERTAEEDLCIVAASWPRRAAFADGFERDGFGADWIAGWGTVSIGRGRLALIPTPRQTGAGVFLRGTERWRDVVLEAALRTFRSEFWAYARYADDGSFVRVGARGGYWYVEEKSSAKSLPRMLARAPIPRGTPPASVRLVVKGTSVIVHVNGRMLFGRAVRVSPAVAQGRVLLGVYDARRRSAYALLTSFRARPADPQWLASSAAGGGALFDEGRMDALREEAVFSRAITPRWISIKRDGGVTVSETQGILLRSLAGYYGCRLVPMAAAPASGLPEGLAAKRLPAALAKAAASLGAAGLNLRLRAAGLAAPATPRLLARLRDALHAERRELWITVDPGARIDPALGGAVDGVLRPSREDSAGFEVLKADIP